MYGHAAHRGEH